jgi:glycosyltransferase involved in cell wall biosynthesis
VVSGESGLAEAVIAEQTGLLVPENDPQATAQAVLRLLGDGDLRARLGGQARQRVLSEQTWSSRAARYDQLLREILGLG